MRGDDIFLRGDLLATKFFVVYSARVVLGARPRTQPSSIVERVRVDEIEIEVEVSSVARTGRGGEKIREWFVVRTVREGRIGPPPSPRSSPQTEGARGVPTRGVPTQRPRCARRRRVAHATPTPTPTRSPPPVRVPRRVDSLALSPTGAWSTKRRVSFRAPEYHSGGVSLRAGATRVSVRATVSEFETRRVAATLRFRGGTRRLPRAGDPRARQVAQGRIAARIPSRRGRRRARMGGGGGDAAPGRGGAPDGGSIGRSGGGRHAG